MLAPTDTGAANRSDLGARSQARWRVLWLTKGLGRGGTERLLVSTASYFDRSRFDIEVAYLLPWKDAFVDDLRGEGIPVHCLDAGRTLDVRWMHRLRALVTERGFDIVHTHMPLPAAGARLCLGREQPVFFHTEHNMWSRYRWPTRMANTLTYRRNAAVLAVSSAVAASIRRPRWRADTWPRIEVVHHGADLSAIRQGGHTRAGARALLGVAEDALVVGTVGNFTVKKDQRTLLDAFAGMTGAYPAARLVLVGSGPLERELRDAARGLGIEDSVTFTGMRDDVFALLPGFDVFTLSSRFEGLPISLLEAMASGVPCVATEVGGIPEVLTHGVEGLLVAPGDPAALRAALALLLGDPKLRHDMAEAGVERSAEFDLTRAVHQTEQLYEEMVAVR